MLLQGRKRHSHACVFHILWLRDVGMRVAELTNDQEDTNAIFYRFQGIPLCHVFLDVQKVDGPIHAVHHQSGPVVIAV